jgi:hypothetical protein
VKESFLLIAVDGIICGVKVQYQHIWLCPMEADESLDKYFGDLYQSPAVYAVFQPA